MAISDLPLASGRKHIKAFVALGWIVRRGAKNLYIPTNAEHPGVHRSIPDHKEVDRFTLKGQLRLIGIYDKTYRRVFDRYAK